MAYNKWIHATPKNKRLQTTNIYVKNTLPHPIQRSISDH